MEQMYELAQKYADTYYEDRSKTVWAVAKMGYQAGYHAGQQLLNKGSVLSCKEALEQELSKVTEVVDQTRIGVVLTKAIEKQRDLKIAIQMLDELPAL